MNLEAFSELLIDIGLYIGLVPIAIALWYWRYQSLPLKMFCLNLGVLFLLFGLSIILQKNNHKNHFLNYLHDLRFVIFVALMYCFYDKKPAHKQILAGFIIIGSIVVCGYWLLMSNNQWNEYLDGGVSIIVALIASYYLATMVSNVRSSLINQPLFWISMGVVLASLAGVLSTYFAKRALAYPLPVFLTIWNILSIIGIVCKILYAIGFYKSKQAMRL